MDISRFSFRDGLKDGMPIALGYLSVSFGFGVSAVSMGIGWLAAALISLTNVTSAGQVAGVAIIAAAGSLGEIALSMLVINIRYFLMSISLSQKLDDSCTLPRRLLIAYGVTDEIFAVSSSKEGPVGSRYMAGLILLPVIGWTIGTLLGGIAGELLPYSVSAALGIAIYGMFVAIIMPVARKDKGVLLCVCVSVLLSCLLKYIPLFSGISAGFSVIICAIVSAAAASVIKPVKEAEA